MLALDKWEKRPLFFDGGMGSMLQAYGLPIGKPPEMFNLENPEAVVEIHRRYLESGSHVISANTFGANRFRSQNMEEIVQAALTHAKAAVELYSERRYIALDVGPCGMLLEPMGDLKFDECYDTYREIAVYGERYGADLVILETFSDIYELKAAVLAVKENTSLPVICSMTFDQNGRSLTGCGVSTFAHIASGLGVDALGINCGLGPKQASALFEQLFDFTSKEIPVIVQPNAGLPELCDGKAVYDLTPEDFAMAMAEIYHSGARILGGCCGTTPEHIHKLTLAVNGLMPEIPDRGCRPAVSSYNKTVFLDDSPVIDSRIHFMENKSLRSRGGIDFNAIVDAAIDARDDEAEIIVLDLTGCANEEETLASAVFAIQEMVNLPLIVCSQNPNALEKALRRYNGRAGILFSGTSEDRIVSMAKKYGGVVL